MDERIENPRPIFGLREVLMLPAALGLGILWQNVFTIEGLAALSVRLQAGPALGAAVFTAAIWAFVLLFLGKRARWDRYSIGLAARGGAADGVLRARRLRGREVRELHPHLLRLGAGVFLALRPLGGGALRRALRGRGGEAVLQGDICQLG